MSSKLIIKPLIAVRSTWSDEVVAYPVTMSEYAAWGDEDDAILEQRLFLEAELPHMNPGVISDLELTPETHLVVVDVPIERSNMPRTMRDSVVVRMPCVVVDEHWAICLPMEHTVYIPKGADVETTLVSELSRYAVAREYSAPQILALFPGPEDSLVEIEVDIGEARQKSLEDKLSSSKQVKERLERERALNLLRDVAIHIDELVGRPGPKKKKQRRKWVAPPCTGRDEEIASLRALLGGDERLAVAVTGDELVGKSAIIASALLDRHVWVTSGAQLVAGQSYFGQWQKRVRDVMQAAETLDAILYFDDLADLFTSRDGSSGMASVMRPFLDDKRVRIVGELRPDVLERVESSNYGFFKNLHRLRVEAMDREGATEVLRDFAAHWGKTAPQVANLSDDAIQRTVELVERYEPYRAFPGKAVRFAEELRAMHADEAGRWDGGDEVAELTERDVFEAFSVASGVPVNLLRQDRGIDVADVVAFFERRIIGQRGAIRAVTEAVATVKAGLQSAQKPLANLLFVGPTGVGKTEVARTLARYLFGSPDRLLRFDMSEYMDSGAAERLIRGTDHEDGLLTRGIRRQPFSVVLLDEIEKAHRSVFDLLLQVLGEGRLSDARGRTAFFHNAIVIMTSNLGAAHRRAPVGFGDETNDAGASYYAERVGEHFRPEFVNRIDRVVPFSALSRSEIAEVTRLGVQRMAERRGWVERALTLDVSDAATAHLAEEGFDEAYGARQLRRRLDDDLADPLARLISTYDGIERATVRVVLADELEVEAAAEHGELRFVVEEAETSGTAQEVRGVGDISELRRTSRWIRTTRDWTALVDRHEYLSAQVNMGKKTRKRMAQDAAFARTISQMLADEARLRERIEAYDNATREIHDLEEVAILALLEGEETGEFVSGAEELRQAMLRNFALGALATRDERNGILLAVSELDHERGLDLWLPALFENFDEREWRTQFHLPNDVREGENWPATRTVGPARDREYFERWAKARGEESVKRHFLMSVSGTDAGSLLSFEAGLTRFENAPRRDDTAHLMIRRASYNITNSPIFSMAQFKLNYEVESKRRETLPASRAYDFATRKLMLRREELFGRIDYEDYWKRLEELVASELLYFERNPGFDRETIVFSTIDRSISDSDIRNLALKGRKIEAIKLYRSKYNVGLKEAKESVERMMGSE